MKTKFTPEMREKAKLARAAQVAYAAAQYKQKWLDMGWWEELAQKRGIRLPGPSARLTPGKLNSWAKRLDKPPIRTLWGCTAAELIALNPRTPLRAFVGQMLEP